MKNPRVKKYNFPEKVQFFKFVNKVIQCKKKTTKKKTGVVVIEFHRYRTKHHAEASIVKILLD